MKNLTFEKSYLKLFIFTLFLMFSFSLVHAAEGDVDTSGFTEAAKGLEAPTEKLVIPDDMMPSHNGVTVPTTIQRPNLEAYTADVGMFSYPRSSFQSCSQGSSSLSAGNLGPLAMPFETIMKLLTSELAVFILMFLFFFMLMYGIFHVSLSKAKVFNDQKKQLKIVSVSLSFIVNLSFFGITARRGGPKAVLMKFLELGELFGAIILIVIMFLVLYYLFKRENSAGSNYVAIIAGVSIAMILVGQLLCRDAWIAWGLLGLIIVLPVAYMFNRNNGDGGGTHGQGGHPAGARLAAPGRVDNFNGVMDPSGRSITLSWDARPDNEHISRYEIQRRDINRSALRVGPFSWGHTRSVGPNQHNYEDRQGILLIPYEYRIRAVNPSGTGSWSDVITVSHGNYTVRITAASSFGNRPLRGAQVQWGAFNGRTNNHGIIVFNDVPPATAGNLHIITPFHDDPNQPFNIPPGSPNPYEYHVTANIQTGPNVMNLGNGRVMIIYPNGDVEYI